MARPLLSLDTYLAGLAVGDRAIIGRAITLVESTHPAHRKVAESLLEAIGTTPRRTLRLGITGVPGVGKSTFIDGFALELIARGHRVGVVAVDPSSERSGGSVLGDKTRMARLSVEPRAFIRPSPTSGTLGGVAARTREAMLVLEAAGHDVILVETVGVGQSETAVANLTDLFVLLALPGAGDELQGIKRGIMELADLVVVTKADGDQTRLAQRAQVQLAAALRLLHGHAAAPAVMSVSALEGTGLGAVADACVQLQQQHQASGSFDRKRSSQAVHWLWTLVDEGLRALIHRRSDGEVRTIEADVRAGRLSVIAGAQRLLADHGGHVT